MEVASELREERAQGRRLVEGPARAARSGRYADAVAVGAIDHARPVRLPMKPGLVSRGLKRLFDIVSSVAGLVLLAPFMVLIALLVKATSPGPVLFTSPRVGRYGRVFQMPKFRTMEAGSPSCAREALVRGEERITPLGRVLRRLGLDELPQLWSVLCGDMSLIGPRPLLTNDPGAGERAKFPEALQVRPGISGLAQVSGRNSVSPRRKARLDALYARARSLPLDIMLLARTVVVVVTGKGFL